MFTRFKALSCFLIFAVVFTFLVVIWGENGIYARRSLEKWNASMESALLEKEGEVARLRSKEGSLESGEKAEGELVMAFSDTGIYSPSTTSDETPDTWHGISIGKAFFLSLLPTGIYLVMLYLSDRRKRNRGKKERKANDYGYDD